MCTATKHNWKILWSEVGRLFPQEKTNNFLRNLNKYLGIFKKGKGPTSLGKIFDLRKRTVGTVRKIECSIRQSIFFWYETQFQIIFFKYKSYIREDKITHSGLDRRII